MGDAGHTGKRSIPEHDLFSIYERTFSELKPQLNSIAYDRKSEEIVLRYSMKDTFTVGRLSAVISELFDKLTGGESGFSK